MNIDPRDAITIAGRAFFPSPIHGRKQPPPEAILEATRSLRKFITLAWPVLEPATPLVSNWHLDAVCEHLEAVSAGGIRNLLINIPPRHMKSLAVCVFWPAWEWIVRPQLRFLFASYTMALSRRDSVKCRRLIESPWYQQHFGGSFQLCADQNTKVRYDNDHAGHRIATSVGGSATGEGGDRVVVDDPHNVTERESENKRTETLTWWDETMSTRLNDPKTGAKIVVMQRLHEKDLSGHVLEQGGYEHLFLPVEFELGRRCVTILQRMPDASDRDIAGSESDANRACDLPAETESDANRRVDVPAHHRAAPSESVGECAHPTDAGRKIPAAANLRRWSDPRTEDGQLLWPDRIAAKEIADFRVRLGPEGYAGQFQQRPAPAGGALFRKEWFRYFRCARTEDCGLRTESEDGAHLHSLSPQSSDLSPPPSPTYALVKPDGTEHLIRPADCSRFAVMDPAGTEPGEGRRPCFTVIQVWDVTKEGDMLLIHQYRRQVQAADAARAAVEISRAFDVAYIAIEKDGMGLGVVQQVKREGIAVRAIKARGCKEARSQSAEIRMANGQMYFPAGAAFLFELEKELLSFPRSDYADQVDALSYAAIQVAKLSRPYPEPVESWQRDAEMATEGEEEMMYA